MGFFLGLFRCPRLDGVQKSMNICYKISEREGVHVRVLRSSLLRSSRLTLAFYMAHLERNIQNDWNHLCNRTYIPLEHRKKDVRMRTYRTDYFDPEID
jgi:hypothetical protein